MGGVGGGVGPCGIGVGCIVTTGGRFAFSFISLGQLKLKSTPHPKALLPYLYWAQPQRSHEGHVCELQRGQCVKSPK